MWLEQDDIFERFVAAGTGQWTVLYSSSRNSKDFSDGTYCALAPIAYREHALGDPGWDLTINDYRPGFVQHYEDGKPHAVYHRFADEGVEPLLLHREFYRVRESYFEVSEEFRLYHGLYWDSAKSAFIKLYEDGTDEVALELGTDLVRVKTKFIRQYQAARQLDLLLFVDSYRYARPEDSDLPPEKAWVTESMNAARYPNTFTDPQGTRFLGTKVLPAPAMEHAGVWPFETPDSHYPDFIIDVDENGSEVRYSCDYNQLANYFGANPDAPHYLTPVHFRREVLKKYYDKPELYEVRDGSLSCAGLWSLHIDNDHSDRVVAFLGDLGRDLPAVERDYWRSFNIAPDTHMSETGFRRAFLAQFAEPQAADLRFRSSYTAFVEAWQDMTGWSLYRDLVGPDKHLLQQVRLPLNDTENEFADAVGRLAKIMCDGLHDKEIQARLPAKIENEKSIAKFERLLVQEGYPDVERDTKLLRNIQELRSTGAAHLKGSKYEQVRARILGDLRGHEAMARLLTDCIEMFDSIEAWLAST